MSNLGDVGLLNKDKRIKAPDPDTRPKDWECSTCGHTIAPFWNIWDGYWFMPIGNDGCPRCASIERGQELMAAMHDDLLQRYHLQEGEYAHMTFQTYVPDPKYPTQGQAKRAVFDLVKAWQSGDWSRGILLFSSLNAVGVGKTHLAIAAARAGMMAYTPRHFDEVVLSIWDMPSYVKAVKASYNDGGTTEIQQSAVAPAILVMDDLGAEYAKAQDWYQGLMYDILNARWLKRKATVVTTNLTVDQLKTRLGPRCVSRLLAMTGKPVEIKGEDYRLK